MHFQFVKNATCYIKYFFGNVILTCLRILTCKSEQDFCYSFVCKLDFTTLE